MDAKPNPEANLDLIISFSQILKDDQPLANQLKLKLENALATPKDLQLAEVVAPPKIKPKVEIVEDNKSNVLELASLRESQKELEDTVAQIMTLTEKLGKELVKSTKHLKKIEGDIEESTQHATDIETKPFNRDAKYLKCKEKNKEFSQNLQEATETIETLKQTLNLLTPWLEQEEMKSYLNSLPLIPTPKPAELSEIKVTQDIFEFLRTAAPSYHWSDRSVFKLPVARVQLTGNQHFLGYGPVSGLIPNTDYYVKSWFKNWYDETRELFVEFKDSLCYFGLYKCISMSHIPPAGVKGPRQSVRFIEDILSNARFIGSDKASSLPSCDELYDLVYREGTLKTEYVLFQCVGFNQNLHETLTQYNSSKKRKSESSVVRLPAKKARGTSTTKVKKNGGK